MAVVKFWLAGECTAEILVVDFSGDPVAPKMAARSLSR